MVDVQELRRRRDDLKTKIDTLEMLLKENIRKDLEYYKEFTNLYFSIDRSFDHNEAILKSALNRINRIRQNNKSSIDICISQIFSANEVLYNLDDLARADYALKLLEEKILQNATNKNPSSSVCNYNDLYVRVDIVRSRIMFMTQSDVLSELQVSDSEENEQTALFSRDFCFNFNINAADYYCLITKLEAILVHIKNINYSLTELEVMNSYLLFLQRGKFLVAKKGCIQSQRCEKYCKEFVRKYNTYVFEKYECKKMRGLLVSYLFVIAPGLIDLFNVKNYLDTVDMYYLEWIVYSGQNN